MDDQFGNGSEVAVTSVCLSRGPAVLVISDMTGQVLGHQEAHPPYAAGLSAVGPPVTVSQELLATLYLDNGNGSFDPRRTPR